MAAFQELTIQRQHLGLPPLLWDAYLGRCAQYKAEFLAKHKISIYNGYNGHEGPTMKGPGFIEGCGVLPEHEGWITCAMRLLGQWPAGAGLAVNGDSNRYMCLIIQVPTVTIGGWTMNKNIGEKQGGIPIRTSYLTPFPKQVDFQGPFKHRKYPSLQEIVKPEPEPDDDWEFV